MLRALLGGLLLASWLAWLPAALAAVAPATLRLVVELDPGRGELQVEAVLRVPEAGSRFVLHESLPPQAACADGRVLPLRAAGSRGGLRAWRVGGPGGGGVRLRPSPRWWGRGCRAARSARADWRTA